MRYLIINSDTNSILEEHNIKHVADKACSAANKIEIKQDRVPIYFVQPTCAVCDSEDLTKEDIDSDDWVCNQCGHYTRMK